MGLGLIGAVVPLIPGPPLIWIGALLWAWADGFQRVGWVTLLILAVIAIPALLSDLLVTSLTGRKAGLSWRSIGGAIAGGLIGGIALSWIPAVGTLLGAILGAIIGVVLVEYYTVHDWAQAWRAAKVYLFGFLLARVFEVVLCGLMIVVFIWSIWR